MATCTRRFYYNEQWQCLEERDYAGNLDRQYVWHPYYIDALAVTYDDDQGTKHFYCHDANFNITLALDSSGNPVERYHYSPYGEVTILDANFANPTSSSSIGNEHLYTARRTDPVTGLQLNRHRYYHAELGRWLTRDPIGYEARDMNIYSYVQSWPLISTDPSGLQLLPPPPGGGGPKPVPPPTGSIGCNLTVGNITGPGIYADLPDIPFGCGSAAIQLQNCRVTSARAIPLWPGGCSQNAANTPGFYLGNKGVSCSFNDPCPAGQQCNILFRIQDQREYSTTVPVPVGRACVVVTSISCSMNRIIQYGRCKGCLPPQPGDDDDPIFGGPPIGF